jgi:hypothetical protein
MDTFHSYQQGRGTNLETPDMAKSDNTLHIPFSVESLPQDSTSLVNQTQFHL